MIYSLRFRRNFSAKLTWKEADRTWQHFPLYVSLPSRFQTISILTQLGNGKLQAYDFHFLSEKCIHFASQVLLFVFILQHFVRYLSLFPIFK